jgi:hypothetical protein
MAQAFIGLAFSARGFAASAQAPAINSISGLLLATSPILTNLDIPGMGPLGSISLETVSAALPFLSVIMLPLIGGIGTIPVLSTVTFNQGVETFEVFNFLQVPLRRLP